MIFLDPIKARQNPWLILESRVRNPDGSLQHVYCEGARFHVISWSTQGRHCSETECEINREITDGS